jgi:hypothetical protein
VDGKNTTYNKKSGKFSIGRLKLTMDARLMATGYALGHLDGTMPNFCAPCDQCVDNDGPSVVFICGHSFHERCLHTKDNKVVQECAICERHMEKGIRTNVASFLESLRKVPKPGVIELENDMELECTDDEADVRGKPSRRGEK